VAFLVLLVIAVVVVVVVMRAARASGGAGASAPPPVRRPHRSRPVAPDDDPEFLRELGRRARRDDGSPT
jgi:hypothetical protein